MYVTYSDLIQFGIFIVALIGLVYEIFKDTLVNPLCGFYKFRGIRQGLEQAQTLAHCSQK